MPTLDSFLITCLHELIFIRALCLIALPVALYIAIFYVHLKVLHLGGEEDEFYSSAFQVSLKGNPFHNDAGPKGINIITFLLV